MPTGVLQPLSRIAAAQMRSVSVTRRPISGKAVRANPWQTENRAKCRCSFTIRANRRLYPATARQGVGTGAGSRDRWSMAKLTAATIRKLKPGRYSDDDCIGLYLEVSETNRRSWLYRYKLKGKPHMPGLGNIADVSIPEARDKAADMRKLVRDGVDPIQQRRTARLAGAVEAEKAKTFRQAADAYIAGYASVWHRDRSRRDRPCKNPLICNHNDESCVRRRGLNGALTTKIDQHFEQSMGIEIAVIAYPSSLCVFSHYRV